MLKMAEGLSKDLSKFKLNDDEQPVNYEQAVENSLRGQPLGYIVNSHDIRWDYRFKDDIDTYKPLIDCLEHAFSKPLFCCGGSLKPRDFEKFRLRVKQSTSEQDKDNWKDFKLNGIDVEELLKYCTPATFGDLKQMTTLIDSEVRLASAVGSESFKIEQHFESDSRWFPRIPGSNESIRKRIENLLIPGRHVDLSQYKLNVYGEGGFFKPHVDSPSAVDMIGTLVLCLPSHHKGGELCVNHDGLQHVFDFSEHSGDTSRIQWAAFYSNCIHEVKPVLEGHRVTITYNINLRDYYKKRSFDNSMKKEDEAASLEEHFETNVENPSLAVNYLNNVNSELENFKTVRKLKHGTTGVIYMDKPSHIGILLRHKYVPNALQQHLLKGEDRALFEFLVDKQWKCKLMSVVSRYQTDDIRPFGYFEDGELDEWHQIYEFSTSQPTQLWSSHKTHRPRQDRYGLPRRRTEYRQWRFGIPFIDVYRRAEDGEQVVRHNAGNGYWIGNQVEPVGVDKIYIESAVIVDL